jgi:hypothetical protein
MLLSNVQSSGHPISFSTHVGFSAPFSSAGVTIFLSISREPEPPHLQSAAPPELVTAVGVGHFTARLKGVPPCAYGLLRELVSLATGVGHSFTIADNFGSPRLFHFPSLRSTASSATGVCHKPESFALVWGLDI